MAAPERLGVIYGLHAGDGIVRYIGQTVRPIQQRFIEHVYDSRKGITRPLHNWMRKNEGLVEYLILEEGVPWNILDRVETDWIAYSRIWGISILNLGNGGVSTAGFIHTPESRQKMSEAKRKLVGTESPRWGVKASPELRAKLSAAHVGLQRGEKHPRSKFTESQVRVIKQRLAAGESVRQIANDHGVTASAIDGIKRGTTWAWVQ